MVGSGSVWAIVPAPGKSSPFLIASPVSSARRIPSSAGTLAVAGLGKAVAGLGKAVAGLGGAIVGNTVFAATVAGLSLVNLSAGAVISKPSKFVIVLYTWKLSAL